MNINKHIYYLEQLTNKKVVLIENIKNTLLKRIPFLKEYNVYEHPRDKNRLEAQRIVYNKNVKVIMGDNILTFPQYTISSDVTYYPHKIRENIFHNFRIKNTFYITKPEEVDNLTFRVFILAINQLEKKLSYSKEVMVKENDTVSKNELDKIINDMNGTLFKLEEFTDKYKISFLIKSKITIILKVNMIVIYHKYLHINQLCKI